MEPLNPMYLDGEIFPVRLQLVASNSRGIILFIRNMTLSFLTVSKGQKSMLTSNSSQKRLWRTSLDIADNSAQTALCTYIHKAV